MSRVMRKTDFCLCENKVTAQLISAFVFATSIPLLHKSKISSFKPFSMTVQTSLRQTLSETPKTSFLALQLILLSNKFLEYVRITQSRNNLTYLSRIVRKPDFCLCNCEADQCLCFRYRDCS